MLPTWAICVLAILVVALVGSFFVGGAVKVAGESDDRDEEIMRRFKLK